MTKYKYIQSIPKPLLEDILNNQCIPKIGAGFSLNCDLPKGKRMPLWNDIGKSFAEDLNNYPYSNALDAISAYSFEYSRSKLVEKLSQLLFITEANPGNAHKAFCRIPFDIICTTNFDFLLERAYDDVGKYCLPIIDEEQLAIGSNQLINHTKNVILLKLHGDLHHPNRLVATEQDYDSFLDNYPLISTYLSNLLITRTPLFIGYSLDDTDFRQIWQIISNRLGDLRRPAYVLSVGTKQETISRYKRRGVNVINLNAKSYCEVFEKLFEEIRDYWIENLPNKNIVFNEQTIAELSLPADVSNRLCYISIPISQASFYKSYIFPIIKSYGFSPISSDELLLPGDNIKARETAIIEKADMIIFDAEDTKDIIKIRNILEKRPKSLHLLILSSNINNSIDAALNINHKIQFVNKHLSRNNILTIIENWLTEVSEKIIFDLTNEPERLLNKREYKAAVISAFILLETELRKIFDLIDVERSYIAKNIIKISHPLSIRQMLKLAYENGILNNVLYHEFDRMLNLRNRLIHGEKQSVTQREVSKMIEGVNQIIGAIQQVATSLENK